MDGLVMGLTNAPVTFMWVMNNLFSNLLDHGVIVFLDDVLVYSHSRDEHIQLLNMVFNKLCKYHFSCKPKKCSFFNATTTFLGFDDTPDELKISNAKVKNLCDCPPTITVK